MKEAFCRRARGLEPVTVPHERLRGTLAETHGVMLYEEDVMRVAAALCGLPLAEGETLRRAIAGARGDEEFRFLERGLPRAGRDAPASPRSDAHAVWRELARFAGYAFCKAHAAGYGRLGWQSAYFKTHFPAAWAVGILNHHAGMYPTWVHVEDLRAARRHVPAAVRARVGVGDATLAPATRAPGTRRPRPRRRRARRAAPRDGARARDRRAHRRRARRAARSRASPTSPTACARRRPSSSRSCWPARSTGPAAHAPRCCSRRASAWRWPRTAAAGVRPKAGAAARRRRRAARARGGGAAPGRRAAAAIR